MNNSKKNDQIRRSDTSETKGLRLNKALAQAGIASRRGADTLIAQGRIAVNGVRVTDLGRRFVPGRDHLTCDGKPVIISPQREGRHIYAILNKPVQVVSTVRDPQGRTTVLDLLPEKLKKHRLYPVGRLDFFSEGLLLLTDDGELTLRLTHPRYHLPKTYFVRTRETPDEKDLERMRQGMRLAEGEKLAPVEVVRLPTRTPSMRLTLHQGINRQIRRMCRDLNLTILTLRRMSVGPLVLGDLPTGKIRELTSEEVQALKEAVGG